MKNEEKSEDENLDELDQVLVNARLLISRIGAKDKSCLRHLHKHDTISSLNLNRHSNIKEYSKFFGWKCSYPLPLLIIDESYQIFDHPMLLPDKKCKFLKNLHNLKKIYLSLKKFKNIRKATNNDIYHCSLKFYMDFKAKDPDKYFLGFYDWYYTGGCLEIIRTQNKNILFSTTGQYLNELVITNLWSINKKQKITFSNNPIYEIIINDSEINTQIALRQKNIINILMDKTNNEELNYEIIYKFESEIPFISAFFNLSNFYSLDLHRNIKVYIITENLETAPLVDQIEIKFNKENITENFNFMKKISNDIFCHFDQTYITIYNFNNLRKYLIKFKINCVMECETICQMCASKFKNIIYVVTTHSLIAFEYQIFKNKITIEPLIKWNHMLTTPPIFIKTSLLKQKNEFILLCNFFNEQRICVVEPFNNDISKKHSPYQPLQLKTCEDSFYLSQKYGMCIDPTSDLKERTRLSIVGITLIQNKKKICVLAQNSYGDIFEASISSKTSKKNVKADVDIAYEMEVWNKKLIKERKLNLTYIYNMEPMVIALNCKDLNTKTDLEYENIPERKTRIHKWQISIDELYRYTDLLCKGMLDIWDIASKDSKDLAALTDDTMSMFEPTLDSKMTDWFDKSNFDESAIVVESQNDINEELSTLKILPSSTSILDTSTSLQPKKKKKKFRENLNYSIGF